jgi:hypothetical protein
MYNTFGDRNTLNDLVNYLKDIAKYDPAIADVAYCPNRAGDTAFFG